MGSIALLEHLPDPEYAHRAAQQTGMPWDRLLADGWQIAGLFHQMRDGIRWLSCTMVREGQCITAQDTDEYAVFSALETQADATVPNFLYRQCDYYGSLCA